MNIWLLQTGESLPIENGIHKMRTAVLADKLVERGHNVLWWASAFDHFKKNWVFKEDTELDLKDALKIKAIKSTGYKKNISFSRFIDHRITARKFRKMAPQKPKPDIIITSMPPHDLAYESVAFAKKNKIPVLVDIRDLWPDLFLDSIPKKLQKLIKIPLYKDFKMVKKTMQMADGLIAVTNTFLEWGLKYAEREKTLKDKVIYLGYKRNLHSNNNPNKIKKMIDILKNKFVVTFIGTFATYHNPSILVDCAKKLSQIDINFVLAGDGEFFNEINKVASKMKNVILTGWLNQDEITALLKYSDVGICPTTKTIDLFPNKTFAYFSAGLPVISAFQGNLKEIMGKYQIGFYYPPNDVDTLVSCIKRLYEDKKLYQKMSENAIRVFNEMFDADKIYEEYVDHIEMVVKDYKSIS